MNKLKINFIYNFLYQIFSIIVPILTAPYLARVLGAEKLGIYSYVFSVSSLLNTLTIVGTYNYGIREIAYSRDNLAKINIVFWQIFVLRCLLGIVGIIIYLGISATSGYMDAFMAYFPWLIASYIDISWLYIGEENLKSTSLKCFFARLVTTIGIFLCVKSQDDLIIYILLTSVPVLISNLMLFTQARKYISLHFLKKSYLHGIWKHLKQSVLLFLPQVATSLYLQIDKIMIKHFVAGTKEISFYDNAEKIVTIPFTIITVISSVLMPRIANEFAKNNSEKVEKYLIKAGEFSLFLAIPMTIGIIIIAPKLIPWYLGSEYLPTIYAIQILSLIIISNTLCNISGTQYFTATNQTKILIQSYFTAAFLNIILNACLIPILGFYGAAVASVITSYVSVIIQYNKLRKQLHVNILFKQIVKYTSFSLLMGIIVYITTKNMPPSFLTNIIQIAIGGTVYFVCCIISKDQVVLMILNEINIKKR